MSTSESKIKIIVTYHSNFPSISEILTKEIFFDERDFVKAIAFISGICICIDGNNLFANGSINRSRFTAFGKQDDSLFYSRFNSTELVYPESLKLEHFIETGSTINEWKNWYFEKPIPIGSEVTIQNVWNYIDFSKRPFAIIMNSWNPFKKNY
jgi:hypothetical protein